MGPLDAFLPHFEFSERHELIVAGAPERVDRALRAVSLRELPAVRALFWLRRLGRGDAGADAPFLGGALRGAVVLEDSPGHRIVLGLTGQFWRLRGGIDPARPRTPEAFAAYDRPDACKAVFDFRIRPIEEGRCVLSTETRVHVPDAAARRSFRRYWRIVRPFSGLTRILFLRAVRRRAESR